MDTASENEIDGAGVDAQGNANALEPQTGVELRTGVEQEADGVSDTDVEQEAGGVSDTDVEQEADGVSDTDVEQEADGASDTDVEQETDSESEDDAGDVTLEGNSPEGISEIQTGPPPGANERTESGIESSEGNTASNDTRGSDRPGEEIRQKTPPDQMVSASRAASIVGTGDIQSAGTPEDIVLGVARSEVANSVGAREIVDTLDGGAVLFRAENTASVEGARGAALIDPEGVQAVAEQQRVTVQDDIEAFRTAAAA